MGGLRQCAGRTPAQPGSHIQVQVAADRRENAFGLQLGNDFREDEGTTACPFK